MSLHLLQKAFRRSCIFSCVLPLHKATICVDTILRFRTFAVTETILTHVSTLDVKPCQTHTFGAVSFLPPQKITVCVCRVLLLKFSGRQSYTLVIAVDVEPGQTHLELFLLLPLHKATICCWSFQQDAATRMALHLKWKRVNRICNCFFATTSQNYCLSLQKTSSRVFSETIALCVIA